jgi:hypothetical protein
MNYRGVITFETGTDGQHYTGETFTFEAQAVPSTHGRMNLEPYRGSMPDGRLFRLRRDEGSISLLYRVDRRFEWRRVPLPVTGLTGMQYGAGVTTYYRLSAHVRRIEDENCPACTLSALAGKQ